MHLDNLSGTKEKVYQCRSCGSIWLEEDLGVVRLDNYLKVYCTTCQSTDIEPIQEEEE